MLLINALHGILAFVLIVILVIRFISLILIDFAVINYVLDATLQSLMTVLHVFRDTIYISIIVVKGDVVSVLNYLLSVLTVKMIMVIALNVQVGSKSRITSVPLFNVSYMMCWPIV